MGTAAIPLIGILAGQLVQVLFANLRIHRYRKQRLPSEPKLLEPRLIVRTKLLLELFPDALGKDPKPLKLRLVEDHLKMKDASMEIDIYRVVANSHMADGLMVHVPRDRLLVQGDLFDVSWEVYWWGSSYTDNVRYRKLQVDRDVPVHGRILPLAEVEAGIAAQIKSAQALCASVAAAGLSMRGCRVKTTVDR